MSDDFGNDYITITDEDGQEYELEYIDSIDYKDQTYVAFLPTDIPEDDPNFGLIILRSVIDENNEELFETIDDENEEEEVYEKFMLILFADEEEDDG